MSKFEKHEKMKHGYKDEIRPIHITAQMIVIYT